MRTIDWSCNCAKCLESRVEGRILARELLEDLIVAEEEADRGREVDGECRAVDGVCRAVDQKPESGIDSRAAEREAAIGRIVHYVGPAPMVETPAIIVGVGGGIFNQEERRIGTLADIVVFQPTGIYFNNSCWQDEETKAGGTWHWPEREE